MQLPRSALAALLATGLCTLGSAAIAEDATEPPIALSDLKMERLRYDTDKTPKVVKAELRITNTGKSPLTDIKSRMVFLEASGQVVKETPWGFEMSLAPGGGKVFSYHEGLVPAFEGYELEMTCKLDGRDQRWTWRSPDPTELPQLKNTKPVPGISRLVILGRESRRNSQTGQVTVFCRIKNEGEKDAQRAQLICEFLDDKGKILATHEQLIGDNGTVSGGKELPLNINVPKAVPNYHAMRVKLSSAKVSDEESLSGGKFSERAEVEVAEVTFARQKPTELTITAKVRNGLKKPVDRPTVVWSFADKDKEVKRVSGQIPLRLEPGEIKAFQLTVPDCPSFGSFGYEVDYQETKEAAYQPVTAEIAAGKAGATRIELSKDAEGNLKFRAQVGNRAPHDVTAFSITFKLIGGADGKTVVGQCAGGVDRLAAGARAMVEAEYLKPPKFANYTYHVTYSEPTPAK
ncbi:MAG TPA: hypothetical protein PK280_18860 [Planctomycetota bacterium]|nr:hypothetical protein [Planctomycetota bacterium]